MCAKTRRQLSAPAKGERLDVLFVRGQKVQSEGKSVSRREKEQKCDWRSKTTRESDNFDFSLGEGNEEKEASVGGLVNCNELNSPQCELLVCT